MPSLPSGTITFLFTDIEGSTQLWEKYPEAMKAALAKHDSLLRAIFLLHSGHVFKTMGDAFYVAFASPSEALQSAIHAQQALQGEIWDETVIKVRMALHCGEIETRDNDYFGQPLNRVARLLSAGHGGQVLISTALKERLDENLPALISLRDMGEHRLKDLIRPEHIYQLVISNLISNFPPLKTLDTFRTNLPAQLTTFIGREKEIADIKNELGNHRLITLTGSGGTGKTRLSIEIATNLLDEFLDGVWFVELAPLAAPELVVETIFSTIGLVEQSGKSITQSLTDFFKEKKALLVLDNCEHLLDACAQSVTTLLTNAPALKILATSREALGATGEMDWRVPSLSLPDVKQIPTIAQLNEYESVRLFIERAMLAQPNFQLTKDNASAIVQICFRLDGIPLALELAASRLKTLSVDQIATRLDDRFRLLTGGARTALPRQQTLRAMIDWSYNLLSEQEKTVFRRLSVFVGGWTFESVEIIFAEENVDSYQAFDLLDNLVDKSLVIAKENFGQVRYYYLETIRQYAREKLQDTDEMEPMRNQHLAWVLTWAEKIEPEILGRNQVAQRKKIEDELDNVRSAVDWGLGTGQAEMSMRIVVALKAFWDGHIPYQENRRWLELGLSFREALSKNTLIKVVTATAWLGFRQNDLEMGIPRAEESLALAEELGDELLIANALQGMAVLYTSKGDFIKEEFHFEKARLLFQKLGNKRGLSRTVGNHALTLTYQGNISGAINLLEEYHELAESLDDVSQCAWFQFMRGSLKVLQGEFEQATILLKKSLLLFHQLSSVNFIGHCLVGFAGVANGHHQAERAAQLFGAREAIHESIGAILDPGSQRIYTSLIAQTRSMLSESAFATAWAKGRAMTMEEAIEYALEVEHE